ncbi:toprim domain-containing protein [Pseudomonas syringae]|nr:toprim domain-containing protein [Pseudomonas syringae]
MYICEGFFDALRLESLGLPAVAIMGASISKEQVQIIKSLSDTLPSKHASLTVCICFDRDEAGLRGASEAALKLLSANLDVLFVWPTAAQLNTTDHTLHSIKDPDEYLCKLSAHEAKSLFEKATYGPSSGIS